MADQAYSEAFNEVHQIDFFRITFRTSLATQTMGRNEAKHCDRDLKYSKQSYWKGWPSDVQTVGKSVILGEALATIMFEKLFAQYQEWNRLKVVLA